MFNLASICCNGSLDEITSLFYVNNEKVLFLICGPDKLSDSKLLEKSLKTSVINFSKIALVNKNQVKTMLVGESKNYKNMRVFYAHTSSIPKGTLELKGKAWTMLDFLKL